jgi:hypothetical protein
MKQLEGFQTGRWKIFLALGSMNVLNLIGLCFSLFYAINSKVCLDIWLPTDEPAKCAYYLPNGTAFVVDSHSVYNDVEVEYFVPEIKCCDPYRYGMNSYTGMPLCSTWNPYQPLDYCIGSIYNVPIGECRSPYGNNYTCIIALQDPCAAIGSCQFVQLDIGYSYIDITRDNVICGTALFFLSLIEFRFHYSFETLTMNQYFYGNQCVNMISLGLNIFMALRYSDSGVYGWEFNVVLRIVACVMLIIESISYVLVRRGLNHYLLTLLFSELELFLKLN